MEIITSLIGVHNITDWSFGRSLAIMDLSTYTRVFFVNTADNWPNILGNNGHGANKVTPCELIHILYCVVFIFLMISVHMDGYIWILC